MRAYLRGEEQNFDHATRGEITRILLPRDLYMLPQSRVDGTPSLVKFAIANHTPDRTQRETLQQLLEENRLFVLSERQPEPANLAVKTAEPELAYGISAA